MCFVIGYGLALSKKDSTCQQTVFTKKKKKEREKGNTKLPNLVRDDSLLDHISPIQEKAIERKNNQGVSFFFLQFAAVKQSCAL